jgi:hypothetical protein
MISSRGLMRKFRREAVSDENHELYEKLGDKLFN